MLQYSAVTLDQFLVRDLEVASSAPSETPRISHLSWISCHISWQGLFIKDKWLKRGRPRQWTSKDKDGVWWREAANTPVALNQNVDTEFRMVTSAHFNITFTVFSLATCSIHHRSFSFPTSTPSSPEKLITNTLFLTTRSLLNICRCGWLESAGTTSQRWRRTCRGRTPLDQNPSCQVWSLHTGCYRFRLFLPSPTYGSSLSLFIFTLRLHVATSRCFSG